MHFRTLRSLSLGATLLGCLSAATAFAQIDPEGGDVWVPPADEQPPQQQPWYQGGPTGQQQQQRQVTGTPGAASSTQPTDTRSDHSRVVNRLAVGFMGMTSVPIGTAAGGGLNVDTVAAPTIGVRYWITELAGIDIGLGIGYLGGSVQTGIDSSPVDNAFALAIHGGVPLAIFHERHYKFLIIPEINLAFATGTAFGGIPDQDRGRNGFLFQIGGRVGTEIHFGFMNIPQLSLQASVGIYFDYISASVGSNRVGSAQPVGLNVFQLGTTVMGEPWDIFLGSLTALYYF